MAHERRRPQLLAYHIRDMASNRGAAGALLAPRLITTPVTSLLAAGVFRTHDYTSAHNPLAHLVLIYPFRPVDPTAPAYAFVMKEINDASLEAVLGGS